MLKNPTAVYKLKDFPAQDLGWLANHFSHLHISELLSRADFNKVSDKLGGEKKLRELLHGLAKQNPSMGLLTNPAPPFLEASIDNPYWRDVLERGMLSKHLALFDLPRIRGTVLPIASPILEEPIEGSICAGKLRLQCNAKHLFFFSYKKHRLPIALHTYAEILNQVYYASVARPIVRKEEYDALLAISAKFEFAVLRKFAGIEELKIELSRWISASPNRFRVFENFFSACGANFLWALLDQQHFSLVGEPSPADVFQLPINVNSSAKLNQLSDSAHGTLQVLNDSPCDTDAQWTQAALQLFVHPDGLRTLRRRHLHLRGHPAPGNAVRHFHLLNKTRGKLQSLALNIVGEQPLIEDGISLDLASEFIEKKRVSFFAEINKTSMLTLQILSPQTPCLDDMQLDLAHKLLALRRSSEDLFMRGDYVPLSFSGESRNHLIGFMRRYQGTAVIVAVPRWISHLRPRHKLGFDSEFWQKTALNLPKNSPREWTCYLSGETFVFNRKFISAATLFRRFPIAVFVPLMNHARDLFALSSRRNVEL